MGSFSLKGGAGSLGNMAKKMAQAQEQIKKDRLSAMNAVITTIYQTAIAKRPYITAKEAKAQGRKLMKTGKIHRVSDPNASYGVPVAMENGGSLQSSIKKEVKESGEKIKGRVWTDSVYAKFLEFGTSKMPPRPFMRPALELNREFIKKRFSKKK